ncbi:hypothetical protein MBANPS3_009831 [Mucor bainieri]
MPASFTQKLRQILCCEPTEVDQNEGPPPSTATPQAATSEQQQQTARQPTEPAEFPVLEQPEPIEEDWGDEETEPAPYKPEDFIVEESEYGNYTPFPKPEDVHKAFEDQCRAYERPNKVDLNTIWQNREYERSLRNWNPDQQQEVNPSPSRAQATAR